MKTKTHLLLSLLLLAGATVARAESVVVQTAPFRLDLRPSPRKVEPGASESLAFGDRWADASRSAATVNVSLDGADYATLPGSEGTVDWTPDRGGLFTFTHTALDADGTAFGDVYQASFVIDNFRSATATCLLRAGTAFTMGMRMAFPCPARSMARR